MKKYYSPKLDFTMLSETCVLHASGGEFDNRNLFEDVFDREWF